MTIGEVSSRHNIPLEILQEYEKWKLPGTEGKAPGRWQYDESDLENLGVITTLYDSGFTAEEAHEYMRLLLQGTAAKTERLKIIAQVREAALSEIHIREEWLARLDYLKNQTQKAENE